MKGKIFLGVIALIAAISGLLLYSSLSSPEAKLFSAFNALMEEESVQVESEFTLNHEFDFDSNTFYSYEEEKVTMMLTDIMEEVTGTSSVIYDKKEKVIEIGVNYDLSGDIHGDEVSLSMPFRLYLDENKNEIVIDLDAYSNFSSDMIDVLSYNVFPHIPEVKETLALSQDGEYSGTSTAYELESYFMPIIKNYFEGKAYIIDWELEDSLFEFEMGEEEAQLAEFILTNIIENIESQGDDNQLIQEEDGWIIITFDDHELVDAILYAFEEVENNDDMADLYENIASEDLDDLIEELELTFKEFKEYSIGETTISFEIEQNKIVTMKTEMTSTYGENGITAESTSSSISTFTYGDEAEFMFYGEDRQKANLDGFFYDFDKELDNYLIELYGDWSDSYYTPGYSSYYDYDYDYDYDWDWWDDEDYDYDEWFNEEWDDDYDYDYDYDWHYAPEDYAYYYDYYDVTEDQLEAIENQDVTHLDFGLSEEDMYSWVLELEFARLVEPGTAAHYLPRL
ncbi:hypothetical protein HXA34_05395 [Salipaludibacillus agaradhaerens]|uniref:hypothetical protein n=1 Tax=Salipaludibacillus agaradhaerens TaxID=76935 RepID=UPI00215160EB|nr:hypothetical protein [Salipaludibacillus agaradhaerens]MCR6105722.1 hypothetical protein [Salipaludibacillus agaradhaerens]MCR6117758.1 hypothetical protein [Salipaludibacillus agaradhaerens]